MRDDPSSLPRTWTTAPLGDLGEWFGGGTPSKTEPRFWNGDIPWVSPKDMKRARIADSTDHITQEALSVSPAALLPPGAVLIVTRSGILAHTLPVAVTDAAVTVNQDLRALVPSRRVHAHYVAAALRAHAQAILDSCSKNGTTVHSVDARKLAAFRLPLAPSGEQQRVVDAIDSYFSRLDEAEAALERVTRNLRRYRASILHAAVEGRLVPTEAELARGEGRDYEPASELLKRIVVERRRRWEEAELARLKAAGKPPKDDKWKAKYEEPPAPDPAALPPLPEGWCWATVDMVGDLLLGRQRAPQYLKGLHPHPYLRVANVKDDVLALSDIDVMDFDPRHFTKYRLLPGDILVSEGQSPDLVGQSAIYRGGVDNLCFQKTLHRFRPVPLGPASEFAQLVFRSHVRTGAFRAVASITTNIAHLTLEKFKAAPFPLPPADEQPRIVQECQRLLTLADDVARLSQGSATRSTRLRQAVLKWAFEGKLVDQDPNDEPASVLLERIRAERAQSAVAGTPRRSRRGRPSDQRRRPTRP